MYTSIEKGDRLPRVGEVVDSLIEVVKTLMVLTKVPKLVQEDIQVLNAEKHVSFTCKKDGLL